MTDHTIKTSLLQSLFAEEWKYLVDHRWEVVAHKPEYLTLLSNDKFTVSDLNELQRMMEAEKSRKKNIDPRQLLGDGWRR